MHHISTTFVAVVAPAAGVAAEQGGEPWWVAALVGVALAVAKAVDYLMTRASSRSDRRTHELLTEIRDAQRQALNEIKDSVSRQERSSARVEAAMGDLSNGCETMKDAVSTLRDHCHRDRA